MGRVTGRGNHNTLCDVCGFQYKASEMLRRWDGVLVCKTDWEPRHPQDFVRSRPDQRPVQHARPETIVPTVYGFFGPKIDPAIVVDEASPGSYFTTAVADATGLITHLQLRVGTFWKEYLNNNQPGNASYPNTGSYAVMFGLWTDRGFGDGSWHLERTVFPDESEVRASLNSEWITVKLASPLQVFTGTYVMVGVQSKYIGALTWPIGYLPSAPTTLDSDRFDLSSTTSYYSNHSSYIGQVVWGDVEQGIIDGTIILPSFTVPAVEAIMLNLYTPPD